ncbi:MAG: 6-pyruvoyl tetrahydropterin synthase family protein [Candidatus Aramenus sp.]|jgi:6-pyruvoyltetrahydropterin/6-carboxytetrahydropterin synthase|nr:6-pyruvoyl tetrahydropterin synthase family protein [Candidatus Aramenus sp.]
MKMRIGIEGFVIDSAHYTLSSPSNAQLHGHTYIISVEIEGQVDPSSGFVMDFEILRKTVSEVVKEWDHKLIVPANDIDKIRVEAPFQMEIKKINAPFATAEYIGTEIAKEVYQRLGNKYKVNIRIYEGKDSYAEIEYP